MSSSKKLIQRREAVIPRGLGRFAGDITVVSARGARVIDIEGRELIDFAGGIGVMNIGHCQEAVVRAIKDQSEKLLHTCIHVATYEPYVELCEKLASLLPHGKHTKVMLTNTGAEAVENAIKIARQATRRPAILCYTEAFHGRTMMAMTLTSKAAYKTNCGPFAPEVYRLPFPNYYRDGNRMPLEKYVDREIARIKEAFLNMVPAEQVAAVIIETVQGEGGFVPAPNVYLQKLRQLCDDHGILLIADEIQSGFCRTGLWGAYQHAGIVPHLSTWAKSMGGGLPIGCVIGEAKIMDAAAPGTLGGTYGGNPVACAASLAAIKFMEETNLNARAEKIGNVIRKRFSSMKKKYPCIGDVRGPGAMIGVEFVIDGDPHRPATDQVAGIVSECRENGLLVLTAGTHKNVIRILAPLIIDDADLKRGLDILEAAIASVPGK